MKRFLIFLLPLFMMACPSAPPTREESMAVRLSKRRDKMVKEQIVKRGVKDEAVLSAMKTVPRHLFVPERYQQEAYADYPLPIGEGQTISQPYIVARMTELLQVKKGERVLEVGTGSGYQAAVLAQMGVEVYSVEILPSLGRRAQDVLHSLGYNDAHVLVGDGYRGYAEGAPYDGIIVTAAAPNLPQPLIDQLKVGRRMVIPVGKYVQELKVVIKKNEEGVVVQDVIPVRFVPMVGEVEKDQ